MKFSKMFLVFDSIYRIVTYYTYITPGSAQHRFFSNVIYSLPTSVLSDESSAPRNCFLLKFEDQHIIVLCFMLNIN